MKIRAVALVTALGFASATADVKKFRAQGEDLHKAGKHQESLDTLAKAMTILKIN